MTLIESLCSLMGETQVLTDADALEHYGSDKTEAHQPNPLAICFPKTTEQVQSLVKWAISNNCKLVPSGGRTGLSGGAVAANQEVVVSFDKMNQFLDFNPVDRSITCQAGVITSQLQDYAADNGLYYPVNFASSGSSHIGGNIATNAGGIKVVRYGLTRNWVLGLTVVTGSGEILNLNHGLIKNATGYDLRHLFVGSEGSLGFITEATIGLTRPPKNLTVMVLGVADSASMLKVFETFQSHIELCAFECFSERTLHYVKQETDLDAPFETKAPYYILLEFENVHEQHEEAAMQAFEECTDAGWVVDGVLSQSETQAKNLWRLREDISVSVAKHCPFKNDLSVTISALPPFLDKLIALINERYSEFEVLLYGHIGDGNIHLNILKPVDMEPDTFFAQCKNLSTPIYELCGELNGSVSAEHGVGLLKRDALKFSRSDEEIALMRSLKAVFDPHGIMNPGKMLS